MKFLATSQNDCLSAHQLAVLNTRKTMSGHNLPPSKLTWIGSDRTLASKVGRPFLKFTEIEAAGGIVLVVATIVALILANSPLADIYHDILDIHLEIGFGSFEVLDESIEHLINDGLIVIFFFVVGLEIKRELVTGELSSLRAAALPTIAAVGGMLLPALFFFILNPGSPEVRGAGIPVATDIAFALGIMSLLGNRVSAQLKLFLLALAIVDDIGAIAVIAIFYTESINVPWATTAVILLVLIYIMQRAKIWYTPIYAIIGVVVWYAVLESGVHATVAGVALGLLTPARPLQTKVKTHEVVGTVIDPEDVSAAGTRRANLYVRETVSVAERLENLLHPFSSFLILPLFALANAGISLSGETIADASTSTVTLGVIFGLLGGKTIGVTVFTFIAVKSRVCVLPQGITWLQVVAVGMLAGIGFTVSLFITGLAFDQPGQEALDTQARIGILAASFIASTVGLWLLSRSTKSSEDIPDAEVESAPQIPLEVS